LNKIYSEILKENEDFENDNSFQKENEWEIVKNENGFYQEISEEEI
jgi:hypothetical protein